MSKDIRPEPTVPDNTTSQTDYSLDQEEVSLGRRTFLKGLVGVFAAAWAALLAFPVVRYLWPNAEPAEVVTELVLGPVADFPPGTSKNFKFGSIPALFIHLPNGNMQVFNATCTHLGCTVQYQKDANDIYCACHGGVYDASTGKNLAGPPPKPLTPLKAEVVDEQIVIKLPA